MERFWRWMNSFVWHACLGFIMFTPASYYFSHQIQVEPVSLEQAMLISIPFAILLGLVLADRYTPLERHNIWRNKQRELMRKLVDQEPREALYYLLRFDHDTLEMLLKDHDDLLPKERELIERLLGTPR